MLKKIKQKKYKCKEKLIIDFPYLINNNYSKFKMKLNQISQKKSNKLEDILLEDHK